MNIGLFSDTYTPEINGVVSSVVTLKEELEKNGHNVFVVTTHPKLTEVEYSGNVLRLPGVELKQLYGYVMTSPIHFTCLSTIKDWNLDIIHAHTEFGVGIFARLVAKYLSVPIVSTYHTTYEDYTHYVNIINSKTIDRYAKKAVGSLSKIYADSSAALIVPSEKTKTMLLGYGVKRDIHVVPTGIDIERFDLNNVNNEKVLGIKKEYNIKDDDFVIVFVGRIAKEKAIDLVIDGFKELKDSNQQNVKLLIVGGGPEVDNLKLQTKYNNLEDYVIFTGKQAPEDVPSFYHASNLFVSASQTETQGMTFIEALASGLPVFARDKEVLGDLLVEDETGYYFDSAKEFASKVITYLNKRQEEKEKMKHDAVLKVMPYDSRVFYKRVIDIYYNVVDSFKGYYTVESVKSKDDFVELKLVNSDENLKAVLSFDLYMSMNIRLHSALSHEQVAEILEQESLVKAYESCIKKLMIKDRTRKEMYDFLTTTTDLYIGDVNELINHLEMKGYINDEKYARAQASSMQAALVGNVGIYKKLKKKGIAVETIDMVLSEQFEESTELENAIKYANKVQRQVKDKSVKQTKAYISNKLFTQGFNQDIINKAIAELDFIDIERNELDVLREIAKKAKKRYERKHLSTELRNRVFRYCASQGFDIDDIYFVLSEMEWDNEQED